MLNGGEHFAHTAQIDELHVLAGLQIVALQQGDHRVLGGRALAHDADHFALQAGDILNLGAAVKRKTIGRHAYGDRHQIAAAQDRIDHRAADAGKIDIAGDHRLRHAPGAGDKNILHRYAVFQIELGFADEPERKHRPARLRIADAHRRAGGE